MDRGQEAASIGHRAIYPLGAIGKGSGAWEGEKGRTFTKPPTPAASASSLCFGSPSRFLPTEANKNVLMRSQYQRNTWGRNDYFEGVARHREGL